MIHTVKGFGIVNKAEIDVSEALLHLGTEIDWMQEKRVNS